MDVSNNSRNCMLYNSALTTILVLSPAAGIALAQNDVTSPTSIEVNHDRATANTLDTLVVRPTGEPEAKLPLGTGISGKTLTTTPGSGGDPLRTLQSLPGLVFTDDSEPQPAVRGSRPDDNYFQVDFLPANYLFHAGGLISVFNPDLVKSFDIYPSAYGPEFAGVNGGVFDVKLRDPETDKFSTTLDISMLQAGLLLEGPVTENQSFYLSGRLSYIDLLIGDQLDDTEGGVSLVQFPKYTDYQAKYIWKSSDDTIVRFQANGATDDVIVDITEDAPDIQTDPILAGRFQEAREFDQQGVVIDTTLRGNLSVKTAFSHSAEDVKFRIGGAGSLDIGTDILLGKSHVEWAIGEHHDLSMGGQIQREKYIVDLDFNVPVCTEFEADCNLTNAERILLNVHDTITSGQFFIKDNWYINDRLTLFPGVVVQTEDLQNNTFIEPRIALEYSLTEDLTLTMGAGLYHQSPGIEQLDETIGNPELKYIESTQFLVGLKKEFGDGWDIKSELYYKQLENLVTGDDELRYANNGSGNTYGLDTLIRKQLTNKFSGWLSISVSDSSREHRATGEKFDFEFDQPANLSLVASYEFSKKWTVGAKLGVHSGALYTPVVGATPDTETPGLFNPEYGPLNSKRFPIYQRLDIRLDRTVKKSKGRTYSTYLDILNVLNNRNTSYYEYNADYTERTEETQIPFIVALGFKAKF